MKATALTCVLTFCIASIIGNQPAEGRPQYGRFFLKTYAEEFRDYPAGRSCVVCHAEGDDKSRRNNYGDAIATTLPKKGEKDLEKFVSTLREVEKLPSAIPGKTFGDLIKEHRMPASK